jgi:hypothetical protein
MAEKVQLNTLITTETRDMLRQICQERGVSQGDVVETALLAFLRPSEHDEALQRLAYQQEQLLQGQQSLLGMFTQFLTLLEALPAREPVPPAVTPIATYEQMYGPIDAAAAPGLEEPAQAAAAAHLPRPRRWLRRWFLWEASS